MTGQKGRVLFAIGDVHGCASELRILLNKLPLTPESTVLFIGDYIDKGSQSFEVIETILELQKFCKVVALMGNHEAMFLEFLDNSGASPGAGMFIYNGGSATLASYANEEGKFSLPQAHLRFLCGLELSHVWGDYFFVHAGLPDVPIEELDVTQYCEDMLWIREKFLSSEFSWSKTVVHGHSAQKQVQIRPNRINIDTGCIYGNRLTAMEFPSRRIYSVAKQDKVRHVYLRDRSGRVAVRFEGALPVYIYSSTSVFEFETINYNEFGLLIRSITHVNTLLFSQGERLKGHIGTNQHNLVRFDGVLVRVEQEKSEIRYAIQMDVPLAQGDLSSLD